MRESERDELVEIMEQMGGLSHTAAAAAIAQGAAVLARVGDAPRPRAARADQRVPAAPLRLGDAARQARDPHRDHRAAVAAGVGETLAAPRAAVVALARPPPRQPRPPPPPPPPRRRRRIRGRRRRRRGRRRRAAARRRAPSRRPTAASAASSERRRPSRRRRRASAARRLLAAARRDVGRHFLSEEEEGSDAQGGPLGPTTRSPTFGPSAPPRARAARSSGSLSSRAARGPSRAPATPLSACRRAASPSSPGGRSVKAAVVLRDLYVLDVEATAWTLIEFCGVPPSRASASDRSRSARR